MSSTYAWKETWLVKSLKQDVLFKSVTPWCVVLGATLFGVVKSAPFVNGDVESALFVNDDVESALFVNDDVESALFINDNVLVDNDGNE